MKKLTSVLLLIIAAIMAVCIVAGCDTENSANIPADTKSLGEQVESTDIGQGSLSFPFEVTDDKGDVSYWNIKTDETTVGAALLKYDIISGEESDFGLMATHVNGQRADYNADGAYWAFFIDGEYAMSGADATDIEQGKVYAFVYTPAG